MIRESVSSRQVPVFMFSVLCDGCGKKIDATQLHGSDGVLTTADREGWDWSTPIGGATEHYCKTCKGNTGRLETINREQIAWAESSHVGYVKKTRPAKGTVQP